MARKKNYTALIDACDTGTEMAERPDLRNMKIQGFPSSGKTHFALRFFASQAESKDPAECLLTIIDCDFEGQAELIKRDSIMPKNLRARLLRRVCRNPAEVNDMVLAFIDLHRQHSEEYPDGVRVMVFENEGAYYQSVRDYYSQEVHGMSEGELLLSRQTEAVASGKKTLPTFAEGQMHSYKVINKLFFQPFERLKMGGDLFRYHFISTTLLRTYTEGFGTANENRVVAACGRPDITDPLFDWIVELTQQQRPRDGKLLTRHIASIKKSRTCEPFRLENPTQKSFWATVKKQQK